MYEYYIHKSTFSEQSYGEFKESIRTKELARNMTDEDVENVINELNKMLGIGVD